MILNNSNQNIKVEQEIYTFLLLYQDKCIEDIKYICTVKLNGREIRALLVSSYTKICRLVIRL